MLVLREEIAKVTNAIVREFSPERVVLFGSHARGNHDAESDVDLLVILRADGKSRHQQVAEIYRRCHRGFPMDIVVRTPEEFAAGMERRDWFLQEIAVEGQVLYAA